MSLIMIDFNINRPLLRFLSFTAISIDGVGGSDTVWNGITTMSDCGLLTTLRFHYAVAPAGILT